MLAYITAVAIVFCIYALLTLSLNLHFGFTGLINFGHVGFFAIGAYAAALCSLNGMPYVVGFTAAAALAALAAWPLGLLALRLREDYLAIVTLAFSEIVRVVITAEEWLTNGVQGLPGIPRPFASLGIGGNAELAYLALVVTAVVLAILLIRHLVRSPFGRLIQAIRDDEVAVKALGKNPAGVKVRVFMIGAAIAGIAGALYAHYMNYIVPDQFLPLVTFYVWMAMILGGAGSISGSLVGAGVLIGILEGSRVVRDLLPNVMQVEMASLRLALVGLLLVLFVLYRPNGLMVKRDES
ncbi:branched-chain amino acid ABC transporter permease [Oceanibacterium hippocampi]|uniref:Leucine/isoleucine/valine transporter permease subunit n=1 Tax=Oceanibacterium hippocampi TaxID=745714 RepID=A0A1Y5TKQ9_9PROT|nr:branched-chain amino acid ABC transporter permease [Oceanibacterium hippocampi]SLN64332.1 leucine/isoleucine/valine transporter permease subunit [Oceanibacterium hippocampi]